MDVRSVLLYFVRNLFLNADLQRRILAAGVPGWQFISCSRPIVLLYSMFRPNAEWLPEMVIGISMALSNGSLDRVM